MAQGENESLLRGINFAALVMDGFDTESLLEPRYALEQAGASLHIVSAREGQVHAEDKGQASGPVDVHLSLDNADPQEFAGVLLPSGARHIALLRQLPAAREFIQDMARDAKPIAALGEGIALLVDAGVAQGHSLAGHPDFKEQVLQAGGKWTDQEVVVDGFLVCGRTVEDLPAFIDAALNLIEKQVLATVQGTRDENAVVGPGS